jgi:signal transduction histidine kinase
MHVESRARPSDHFWRRQQADKMRLLFRTSAVRFVLRIAILLVAGLPPAVSWAADPLPRSVLILDQSDRDSAWYAAFSPAFRSTLNAASPAPVAVYAEHLDLSRFRSAQHDEVLRAYLRNKFRGRPIGVLVVQGSAALEFVMRARAELWPEVPVVFAAVDEESAARLNLPPDMTGTIYQLPFHNTVTAAQALVPNLKRIALVGDPWERQAVRRHYQQDIPAFAAQFEFIDLIGLPMTEIRKRVAALPDDTAIVYTSVTLDGAGSTFIPNEGLAAFADLANRPIVVDADTNIGHGGTGGFVGTPVPIAQATARLALRVLDGENASTIPVIRGDFTRPVFDWRQLQRFGISETSLPAGSEIRFRPPGLWDQYRWQAITALAVVLFQAALIAWLLLERRRRQSAQLESRRRLLEVIHLNRTATAGALSASVAHELNQPLGAILSNAEAAEVLLSKDPPDLHLLKDILADIRRDDQRAGEIIRHLRGLLKKGEIELHKFDLNDAIDDAVHILEPEATKRGVVLSAAPGQAACPVRADQVHVQQVLLNLAANGMDAMLGCAPGKRRLEIRTALNGGSQVEVSVADSGTGIPKDQLNDIFETFYTTKPQGTGLGLSIARTLVETYGGKIWAENRSGGGAVFRFTLPLAEPRPA